MRIYGTSPLYNYVELVFRCKRMFVVSILLGSVICSVVVWSRSTMYEAGILVALSGDPTQAMEDIANQQGQRNPQFSPAARKANRMSIWLQREPEFLEEVVQDAQLDKVYRGRTTTDIARDIRKKLTEPSLLNEMFLEVKLTWPKPDEAEKIMNGIYSRFQERTITLETLASTNKRTILEEQLKTASAEADRKQKAKVAFETKYWFQKPEMIANNFSQREMLKHELTSAQIELEESRTRLTEVSGKLARTSQYVKNSVKQVQTTVDPTLQIQQDIDLMKKELGQILSVYSPEHPKARELQRKIDLAMAQMLELKKQPGRPKEDQTEQLTVLSPTWQMLDAHKSEMEERVRGYEKKVGQLANELATVEQRIKAAPQGDVQYAVVEREWRQADMVRQYTENQLAAARLDEQKDRMTQARSVKLEVAPKSEKVDSGAKTAFLYALGPILGMIIAFCFSLVAESLDHTLRTPIEVERFLGKPVLAVIPKLRSQRAGRKGLASGAQATIGS